VLEVKKENSLARQGSNPRGKGVKGGKEDDFDDCKDVLGFVADFIIADRARIVEECAKIAESKAREIIDMQTGLRSNPALEIAESLRRAGRKD
jgi:hypothetical protein